MNAEPTVNVKKSQAKLSKSSTLKNEEQVRLELINLAVMLRSEMIGRDEFETRARSMGVSKPVEHILEDLPLPQLG